MGVLCLHQVIFFVCFVWFVFLRQSLAIRTRLALSQLCSPGWPQIYDLSPSVSECWNYRCVLLHLAPKNLIQVEGSHALHGKSILTFPSLQIFWPPSQYHVREVQIFHSIFCILASRRCPSKVFWYKLWYYCQMIKSWGICECFHSLNPSQVQLYASPLLANLWRTTLTFASWFSASNC
jgi:hypothetical protein